MSNSAFPHQSDIQDQGMTLRDYFAVRCPLTVTEFLKGAIKTPENNDQFFQWYAKASYQYADAMLAARTKGSGND